MTYKLSMLRNHHIVPILLLIVMVVSCTSSKNTASTRWYHSFNTRYNVYFNGEEAFKEAMKAHLEAYPDNYSEMIRMYPANSFSIEQEITGGPFDKSIEKSVKAIKTHSITTKPEKQSGKRNDPKYQEFMSREEYNPFLHNAWMLMAKSQFYNGDFLRSASSFSYVARHYASQPEIADPAKLWQARSYVQMEWFYEAEDILTKMNNSKLSEKDSELLSNVYADYLIKQKKYSEAVPYLQMAIKSEDNGRQRSRMQYLLGQIYTHLDQNSMAYQTFGDVIKSNPPYKLEFSARIRQTEVYPGGDSRKVIGVLKKMAKNSKNKEYLDQVYYALGNVYMNIPDTLKAIESYESGAEKSTNNGIDKALCQIKLGDIYFQQRDYVKAQPNYSEALSQLKKDNKDYARISKRSEALDELVIYYEAVQLQDSLQRLSRMSEPERLIVVNKIIDELKKKEEEEKKKAERDEFIAQQEAKQIEQQIAKSPRGLPAGAVVGPQIPSQGSDNFYFYNPQAVSVGKTAFQQKWGRRRLEDDWRRRNKANPMGEAFAEDTTQTENNNALPLDSVALAQTTDSIPEMSSDPHNPQFYLQQIPVTEEDIAASNLIIVDGLFNMGLIYKDKLEDFGSSIESFDALNNRFPENEHKLTSYYNLYLIYLKLNNLQMAELYKSKIRAEFPESDYAIAMADPDYEYNIRMMTVVQDSLYQQTYKAYLQSNYKEIRDNYKTINTKYSQSKLMPKFMFLDALSYVMTRQADTFKVRLKTLIEKYPDADVSVLAGEMMSGFQRGLSLSGGDGNLAKGELFNIALGGTGDSTLIGKETDFSVEKNTPYILMLAYPAGKINEHMLLFMVAEYNFSNFMVSDFDLQFQTFGSLGMLQIKGFNNYNEAMQYWQMIYQPGGYAPKMDNDVVIIPISTDNFNLLTRGKTLDQYTVFFEEQFGAENAALIEKWNTKKEVQEKETPAKEPTGGKEQPQVPVDAAAEKDSATAPPQPVVTPVINTDSIPDNLVPPVVKDTISMKGEVNSGDVLKDVIGEENYEKTNDVLNKASDTMNDVENTIDEITSDPVRGIQNLFKKKKSNPIDEYVKEQEKADKERQKQLKKEQEEQEKVEKEAAEKKKKEQEEFLKKQQEEEKSLLKQKEDREKELEKIKKAELKQKEEQKALDKKAREDARKLKKKQYEAEQKEKAQKRKEKQEAYKKAQKEKEKLRKETQEKREKEREEAKKRKEEENKK